MSGPKLIDIYRGSDFYDEEHEWVTNNIYRLRFERQV